MSNMILAIVFMIIICFAIMTKGKYIKVLPFLFGVIFATTVKFILYHFHIIQSF